MYYFISMNKYLLLFFIFLLPCSTALAWPGEVVRVVDGDTIIVQRLDDGKQVTIRLYGIDSPEKSQPYGLESLDFLKSVALHKKVGVLDLGVDKYDRNIGGVVMLEEGAGLQEKLISAGLAWVYTKYCKDCRQWKILEEEARTNKKGIWGVNDPISPWEWRKSR